MIRMHQIRLISRHNQSTTAFDTGNKTRSQAVARIADRTASQHRWESRDVIGHLTIRLPICHFLLVIHWNQASISNGFRDIQRRNAMVNVTLMRPLNKGQGHSFRYQSISHIRLPIGRQ